MNLVSCPALALAFVTDSHLGIHHSQDTILGRSSMQTRRRSVLLGIFGGRCRSRRCTRRSDAGVAGGAETCDQEAYRDREEQR